MQPNDVELQINDFKFFLPVDNSTTIANITAKAFSEFTKISRQRAPKKATILYNDPGQELIIYPFRFFMLKISLIEFSVLS